jgi:hypothetical protein
MATTVVGSATGSGEDGAPLALTGGYVETEEERLATGSGAWVAAGRRSRGAHVTSSAASREKLADFRTPCLLTAAECSTMIRMKTTSIVGEPELENGTVVLRVSVEDPAEPTAGGVFVCRLTDYASVSVETFPAGQTPSSSGEDRVEAAAAAMRYALENQSQFDALFERARTA